MVHHEKIVECRSFLCIPDGLNKAKKTFHATATLTNPGFGSFLPYIHTSTLSSFWQAFALQIWCRILLFWQPSKSTCILSKGV